MTRPPPPDPRVRTTNRSVAKGANLSAPLFLPYEEDAMTSKSGKPTDPSNGQLFVYGLDEAGKPKGARFPIAEAERVLPVATAMNLRCSQAGSDEAASLGVKLPV